MDLLKKTVLFVKGNSNPLHLLQRFQNTHKTIQQSTTTFQQSLNSVASLLRCWNDFLRSGIFGNHFWSWCVCRTGLCCTRGWSNTGWGCWWIALCIRRGRNCFYRCRWSRHCWLYDWFWWTRTCCADRSAGWCRSRRSTVSIRRPTCPCVWLRRCWNSKHATKSILEQLDFSFLLYFSTQGYLSWFLSCCTWGSRFDCLLNTVLLRRCCWVNRLRLYSGWLCRSILDWVSGFDCWSVSCFGNHVEAWSSGILLL